MKTFRVEFGGCGYCDDVEVEMTVSPAQEDILRELELAAKESEDCASFIVTEVNR